MNFALGTDSIFQNGNDTAKIDNVNRILFGRTKSLSNIAETSQFLAINPCGINSVGEIDIVINKDIKDSLFCSTNCDDTVPVHKYDLYAILLHELGHAHSLNHINNFRNIMYYGQRDFNHPIPGNERNIYLKYDLSADAGSAYVIQRAISSEITACSLTPMIPLNPSIGFCDSLPGRFMNPQSGCSPFWIGINEIKNVITDFNVFPNPANDNLKIQFTSDSSPIGSFIIYDMYGRNISESKSKLNKGKNEITIDVSTLQNGIYCIGVNLISGNYTSKLFIKQSE